MNCPQCNSPVEPNDRFCENCGSVLTSAKATPASSPYASDSAIAPPPPPQAIAEAPGKHEKSVEPPSVSVSSPAAAPAYAAPAVAAAAIVEPASSSAYSSPAPDAPVINDGPYASAVRSAVTGTPMTSSNPIPTAAPVGETPFGYGQQPFAQYDVPIAPQSPYADGSMDAASGAAFGLAIASLVIGVVGLLTFGIFGFFCVLGIIFGIIALVLRSGYKKKGLFDTHAGSTLGLAVSGLITNVIALLIFIAILVFAFAVADSDWDSSTYDDFGIEQIVEDAETGLKA